ncbi:SHOCT domain-containing protein [Flaviflexus huanghaiensis]|uniref:SHOCT domain-containing protein n=1 Tax=Flaviflexus huanghaiensis TaxID=1111473 RepID=UPI0019D5F0BA|nr:SHOCT domain-containing protein [Flaviflexus huanghaiensis]
MGPNWHMGGGTAWGWVFLVILIIGIVVLATILIRQLTTRDSRPEQGSAIRARELLDERYARGEIDSSEYDERRRRLDGMSGT